MHKRRVILCAFACLSASWLAASGCLDPKRFDTESRLRGFDRLWATLAHNHADVEAIARLSGARDEFRRRAVAAKTRREYVVELARLLAELDDPHVSFDKLGVYWYKQIGQRPTCVCSRIIWLGDRLWVKFVKDAVVSDAASQPAVEAESLYQVLAVDGVPAGALAADLLDGAPGDSLEVTVLTADGLEKTIPLRCPPPPEGDDELPFSDETLRKMIEALKKQGLVKCLRAQRLPQNVGYIWIGSLNYRAVLETFDQELDKLLDTRALIIDLRSNRGGNRGPLEGVLSRFATGLRTYATAQVRIPRFLPIGDSTWWLPFRGYVCGRQPVYRQPVVVLVDRSTLSAAEILAFALRDLCGATLVGECTGGAGAAILCRVSSAHSVDRIRSPSSKQDACHQPSAACSPRMASVKS